MSKTAVSNTCAKCGQPLGESVLLIRGRSYHHECSPYSRTDTSPPQGYATNYDFWKRRADELRAALEEIADQKTSAELEKEDKDIYYGASFEAGLDAVIAIARAALEVKP